MIQWVKQVLQAIRIRYYQEWIFLFSLITKLLIEANTCLCCMLQKHVLLENTWVLTMIARTAPLVHTEQVLSEKTAKTVLTVWIHQDLEQSVMLSVQSVSHFFY